jgi:hypothetical protein
MHEKTWQTATATAKAVVMRGHNKSKILLCAITVQGRDDKAEKEAEKWRKRSDD